MDFFLPWQCPSVTVFHEAIEIPSFILSLTEMIWFRLCSSWTTVDDIKSRGQEKYLKLSSKSNSLFNREMSSLFRRSLHFQASKLSLRSFSIAYCFSRKVTSKNLPLVSCFVKRNFCWQSAEIRLPFHLGSTYGKWLAWIFVNKYLDVTWRWKNHSFANVRERIHQWYEDIFYEDVCFACCRDLVTGCQTSTTYKVVVKFPTNI